MATRRPPLSKLINQLELNKFYEQPVTRVSIGLTFSVICVLFFALFAIKPTLETMAGLIKQIEEKREIDKKLTLKITALNTAQRELAAKEEAAKILDIAVPPSPQFTQLLTIIEKSSQEHGVTLIGINSPNAPLAASASALQANPKIESIPFTATFTGSYPNLISMLRDMQNLQRIIAVDKFDLSPSTEENHGELTLSVAARAFTFATLPVRKK